MSLRHCLGYIPGTNKYYHKLLHKNNDDNNNNKNSTALKIMQMHTTPETQSTNLKANQYWIMMIEMFCHQIIKHFTINSYISCVCVLQHHPRTIKTSTISDSIISKSLNVKFFIENLRSMSHLAVFLITIFWIFYLANFYLPKPKSNYILLILFRTIFASIH